MSVTVAGVVVGGRVGRQPAAGVRDARPEGSDVPAARKTSPLDLVLPARLVETHPRTGQHDDPCDAASPPTGP